MGESAERPRNAGLPRNEDNLMATARLQVTRLRAGLEDLEATLDRLSVAPGRASQARRRPDRYFQLLVDVYEWGRHGVAGDGFAELGRARGYDARGLGGFFVGALAPLLRQDQRVVLTVEGHRLVREFLSGAG